MEFLRSLSYYMRMEEGSNWDAKYDYKDVS
jgi:hypothetical protein